MRLLKRKPSYYKKYFFRYLERFILKFAPSHKPSFMIVGVQKAATTSLFNFLNQQSGVVGSVNKEIYYFSQELDYGKGLIWYHSYFKSFSISGKEKFFEASPDYFYFPWVPERLFKYNPDLKLIVILREPVARAYSAWRMYASFVKHKELYRVRRGLRPGEENYLDKYFYRGRDQFPDFEECVRIELDLMKSGRNIWEPSLVRRGLYLEQIQRMTRHFPVEQLLVVGFKDLIDQPMIELDRIFNFLDLPAKNSNDIVLPKRNTTRDSRGILPSFAEELNRFFEPHNQQLYDFLGYRPNW